MRELTDRAWDVDIVVAKDKPADCSPRPRRGLLFRDLRVYLEVVPAPSMGDPPPHTKSRVSRVAYAVIPLTVGDTTAYVAVPAPQLRGKEALFAPVGTKVPAGSVETGRVVPRDALR